MSQSAPPPFQKARWRPLRDPGGAVVFSDLDGTLLDERTYRFEEAREGLELLRRRGIPLVLCSSKTRREIALWRERLGVGDPFIYENGGGICLPQGLFPFAVEGEAEDGDLVVPLGTPYPELRSALLQLRRDLGVPVTGFGDLTASQVAELTGLSLEEADLARRREFDEPFTFDDPGDRRAAEFLRAIEARGLTWTRGRLFHILGDNDKGRAARILAGFYRRACPTLRTVGIGDAPNDLPLLEAVDVPVLVQHGDGSYADFPRPGGLRLAHGAGPAGWNRAVLEVFAA